VGAPWYEPLPASDRTFLVFEDQHTHMHLGGITLFEPGPLGLPEGGVEIERIRAHIASRLQSRSGRSGSSRVSRAAASRCS